MGIATQTQDGLKFIESPLKIKHLEGTTSTTILDINKPAAGTPSLEIYGNLTFDGDSRYIDLAKGTTSSQPFIRIGEQSLYGFSMRWDSGSHVQFDGWWNSTTGGSANRDFGSLDVNNRIWKFEGGGDTLTINGNRALTTADEGSGNGLDADLLDGQHGTYYRGGAGLGGDIDYVASSTSTSNRGNHGAGVWAYSGYSTGSNRPYTYDATLQVMPTSGLGFELSTAWHSTGEGTLKIRSLRDCCEGWGSYYDIWSEANDGAGSGLNADLLDGVQGDSFARSDASDTLSGVYTFSSTSTSATLFLSGHAGASNYNYFLNAYNDGGSRAVHFVNGTTRTADGGANTYTIRNDGGSLRLGNANYTTLLVGSGDLTYNANEVWHAGNDGSGSTLDADTVDGVHASAIVHGSNTSGTNEGTVTDWNSPTKSGFYSDDNASNRFGSSANWTSIIHHKLYDNNNNYASQIGFDTYSSEMYYRMNSAGTWTSWQRIFMDDYHPNADEWTTARTINFTGGDVTGSVTINGGSDVNCALTVTNDSHTHDDRYYTETESDARFLRGDTSDAMAGTLTLNSGGTNTYGRIRGYGNDNHFITMRGKVTTGTSTLTITGAHQMTFVEHANDANEGWYFVSKASGNYTEMARIDGVGQMYIGGNKVWHQGNDGSGSTLDADTVDGQHLGTSAAAAFDHLNLGGATGDGGEDLKVGGIRGRFSNEHIQLYNKVGIGYPSGWDGDNSATPTGGLAVYGGTALAYNNGGVSIGQAYSSGDHSNTSLEVNGDVSFRAGSHLYFGQTTTLNSWKTKITSNNTSTMTINAQGLDVNNAGYASPAVVWLKANNTELSHKGNTIWHAGNDGPNSGLNADLLDGNHASAFALSSHNHDDRYYTESEMQTFFKRGYIEKVEASNLAVGWYTIATNTGDRALGEFQIWDTASGDHQSVLFNASHHFGTNSSNDITVLANSRYSGTNFRYIRIKENGTYDGAAIQVYIDATSNAVAAAIVGGNAQESGWVLKDWVADGTDPGDVTSWANFAESCKVDLDIIINGGIMLTGHAYTGGATTQYRVLNTSDEGEGNGIDADTVDGNHASAFVKTTGNQTISGTKTFDNGSIVISGTHGTISFMDTTSGEDNFYLHTNSNNFYVLVDRDGTDAIDGGYESPHPLQLEGDTNTAYTFGNRILTTADEGSGNNLDADTVDGIQGGSLLRSDSQDAYTPKRIDFGGSSNWDAVGFLNMTNLHVQGHNNFWFGAGNGTWFEGTANTKSSTSGLAADATAAHDTLITTMYSSAAYDRGITFAVDNTGAGNDGWRLGKWHASNSQASSKLTVDGGLHVRGGQMANFDYYADDYSTYWDNQAGQAYWGGDTGWIDPSITAGHAIQIQAGNQSTNSNNPALQFHQYGYGGIQMRYDGPNDYFHIESTGSDRYDWLRNKTDHGWIDIGPANTSWAHIYTDRPGFYFNKTTFSLSGNQVWHAGNDGSGSGLDADKLDGQQNTQFFRSQSGGTGSSIDTYTDNGFRTLSYTGYSSILWSNNQGGSTGTVQLEFEYNTPARGFKVRNKTDNSTWSNVGWVAMTTSNQGHISGTIWHSGNDGAGTGLDADTVDGIQGASLLRSDASDTYSGGTLTIDGPLNMANTRQISFDRGSSDYSTIIHATNHPPAGYTNSTSNYWMSVESKGGMHVVVNTDGSYNSGENAYDHFTIWQDNISNYNARQFYVTNVGNVYAKGDVTAFQANNMSDIRLKKDIKPIENALDIVDKLNGVTFTWKRDDKKSLGFIAQDVEKVVPELVEDKPAIDDPDTLHKTVNYANMVAILTEAVKELKAEVEELKNKKCNCNGSTK